MKLKKTVILLLILSTALSAGCSGDKLGEYAGRKTMHQYVFKGENELWYAEYRINGEGRYTLSENGRIGFESWSDEKLHVFYKKDLADLSHVRNLKISYQEDGLSSSGYIQETYPADGPYSKIFGLHSGGNGSVPSADATYTVTVNLDGHYQSFKMKNRTSVLDKIDFLLGRDPFEIRDELKKRTGQ